MSALPKYRGEWDQAVTQEALESSLDVPTWLAEALAYALLTKDWLYLQRQSEKHATDAINEAHAARLDRLEDVA